MSGTPGAQNLPEGAAFPDDPIWHPDLEEPEHDVED